MPLPNIFGAVATGAQEPGAALDANFAALGNLCTIACTATGTNAISLTPFATTPTVSAYGNFFRFAFVTVATTTGTVTLQFSALAALPFYFPDGVTQVGPGAISSGQYVETAFSQALNSGGGGFVWLNPTSGAAGASLVLIATATASASASVAFVTGLTATYDEYLFTITEMVPATDATALQLRISEDGGATYKSGAGTYRYSSGQSKDDGTLANSASSPGDTSISIATNVSNNVGRGLSGEVRLFNPAGAVALKKFIYDTSYLTNVPNSLRVFGQGMYGGDTNAINAVQFFMSAGNVASGRFALYGLRKS